MVDMRAASGRDAPPQSALRNGQAWDAIVLQEQSAVPMWYNAAKDGPYDYTKYQNDLMFTTVSAKSMGSIIDAVTPQPHQIILHETWGYWTVCKGAKKCYSLCTPILYIYICIITLMYLCVSYFLPHNV